MYSRNYGFSEDTPSKITPPPDYGGSALQGRNTAPLGEDTEQSYSSFTSQSIPLCQKGDIESECPPPPAPCTDNGRCACAERPRCCEQPKKSLFSGFLSDMSTEDILLIGIVAALAFGVADKDILLVALVVVAVIM